MSTKSKEMRDRFDKWPRALPYDVENASDVAHAHETAGAAILNNHRSTQRQDLLALCDEIEALERRIEELEATAK